MLSNWETYVQWFQADAVNCIISAAIMIVVILMSLILHECAHGWMALHCGDPTAKYMGRLSLNPLKHLHPIGTLCMLFAGFGWAKPVPVNPRNFQNYRRDDFLVSIAGIVTNLTLFLICSLLAVVLNMALWNDEFLPILQRVEGINADPAEMVNIFSRDYDALSHFVVKYPTFNGDFIRFTNGNAMGLGDFANAEWLLYVQRFLLMMAQVNLTLALFNLLPIPPLDGFHVLNDTILGGRLQLNQQAFQAAQLVLIVLMLSTDIVSMILSAGTELIGGSVIRVFMMLTGQM